MAAPEDPDDYVCFGTEDDLTVYVSRDLLERQEPGTKRLRFYIGGYGGYWLLLSEPWKQADKPA